MQIPAGSAQINMVFEADGDSEPMLCTMGYTSGLLGSEPVAIANHFFNSWVATFLQEQSVDITLVRCDVVRGPSPDPLTFSSTEDPQPGFSTGGSAIVNTAVLVQKRTNLGGRRNRGRMFIPCPDISGSVSVAGVLPSGELGEWQDRADAFLAAINEAESPDPVGDLALLHATGSSAATSITALTVAPKVATQRRRLRP
jgi:hypothetical protein